MYHFRRNKSELIVLTGAIYSFVAYLTAFALEILFLIDQTRRGNEILATLAATAATFTTTATATAAAATTTTTTTTTTTSAGASGQASSAAPLEEPAASDPLSERLAFESMQAHVTISCLTISILYLVIFITSLILIVALILRSTFMLLIWTCAMTTMYLPELGLVVYVSIYGWGLETRNGQTELAFFLLRACLNLLFIVRAHKLFKRWNYEKNFFRLKTGSAGGFPANFGPHYDSPYFIGSSLSGGAANDSLTTTINPLFSSSTLNLNRYDFARDQFNQLPTSSAASRGASPSTQHSLYISSASEATSNNHTDIGHGHDRGRGRVAAALYARDLADRKVSPMGRYNHQGPGYDFDTNTSGVPRARHDKTKQFYLGDLKLTPPPRDRAAQQHRHRLSVLSINDAADDDYADYEMDLDYRTLGKSPTRSQQTPFRDSSPVRQYPQQSGQSRQLALTTGQRFQPQHDNHLGRHHHRDSMSQVHINPAHSTQSLDRRNSRPFSLTEQVVLRPLGHQPFEYLQRPGSTTNLNYN